MSAQEEEIVGRIVRCLQRHLGDVWTADARRAAEHIYADIVAPMRSGSTQPGTGWELSPGGVSVAVRASAGAESEP